MNKTQKWVQTMQSRAIAGVAIETSAEAGLGEASSLGVFLGIAQMHRLGKTRITYKGRAKHLDRLAPCVHY